MYAISPSPRFLTPKIKAGLALAFLLGGGSAWAQSTHEVQVNDHYLQGAILGQRTNVSPTCITGDSYTDVPASIGGVTYTATSSAVVPSENDINAFCRGITTPTVPAGNDEQPVDAMQLHTTVAHLQTTSTDTPFPTGTVLGLQDVDANETVDVSFESCDGSPLDTNDFTYVTISTGTAGLPNWSVSGSTWTISTSTPSNDAPNPLIGIQMPANVCKIALDSSSTPTAGTSVFRAFLFLPASSFAPALEVVKSVTSTGPYRAGDTIGYRVIATNTGNVPLTDVSISDPNATVGTCTPTAPAALAIGEALTCEATHVVTAADISAGAVHNTAAAESTPPTVDPANPPDPVTQNSNPVTVPVGVAAVPANAPWALLLAGLGAFGLGARALRRKNLA